MFKGIWPQGADGTDVNSAARSHSNQLLVTGDDFGKVHLYNYPVIQPKVCYLISKLKFDFWSCIFPL